MTSQWKNGNGPGRAPLRATRARCFLALLLAAACVLVFLPARASDPAPILPDTCVLDTPWNEKEGKLPTPTNRQECYEDCEYQYGKDTERCNRKPKKDRPACHSKALEKRTKCRKDCDKKYPE
jgi:hypothetical protein